MKENFGIEGVAVMDNQSFPRFAPLPSKKPNASYTRVSCSPGKYYCEKWEFAPDHAEDERLGQVLRPSNSVRTGLERKDRKTEWLVDLFFLISMGLFVVTFLWAQGVLN